VKHLTERKTEKWKDEKVENIIFQYFNLIMESKLMERITMLKRILILLVVVVAVTGCFRDPKPKNTLTEKKFIEVLTDIHIAEAMYQERRRINLDSLQSDEAYQSVLEKHHVSEEQMLATTLYYSRHPREYDKIYTEVISRMGGGMNVDVKDVIPIPKKKK
jgi:hypothetical protein